MSVLLLLIPVSLALAVAFVVVCLNSIRSGQFDDLESPRWRILFDGPNPAARPGTCSAPTTAKAQLKMDSGAAGVAPKIFEKTTDNPKKDAG